MLLKRKEAESTSVSSVGMDMNKSTCSMSESDKVNMSFANMSLATNLLETHTEPVNSMVQLADGRLVDSTIRIWNISSGQCEVTLEGHSAALSSLVQLAHGRLVSVSGDSNI
jgi:WD40 repeat protein